MSIETSKAGDISAAGFTPSSGIVEAMHADGFYTAEFRDANGVVQWTDRIDNIWCTEGAEAVLTHALKTAITPVAFLGLIESTGYTAVARTNTAANITAVGGGSPANGWNEAPSSTVATRGTPSFGTASTSGSNSDLAASAVALSTLETKTIKGCFIVIRSKAGTASTSAVGNTAGALLSAGLFSGGDQVVSASGTLNVTYTARLTT